MHISAIHIHDSWMEAIMKHFSVTFAFTSRGV